METNNKIDEASDPEMMKKELAVLLDRIGLAQEQFFECLNFLSNEFFVEIGNIKKEQGEICPPVLSEFLKEVEDQSGEILIKASTLADELNNLKGTLHKHKLL